MASFNFIVYCFLQLFVLLKSEILEFNLSPDIWKDNEKLLELDDSPSPDYVSQGFRISEAKCFEYIWEAEQEESRIANVMKYSHYGLFSVTGGRNAKPNEFPHMGALGWQTIKGGWSFKCGSFLISDQFVLTAAHCYLAPRDTDLQHFEPKIVRLGIDNIIMGDEGRSPLDIKIMKFIKHPEYLGVTKRYNDIALVMLRQKVEFSNFVRPACIMNLMTDKAIVTGWGGIDTGRYSKRLSDHLKAAEVDIVDSDTCNIMLQAKISKKWSGVQDYQICAIELNGIGDICDGDSGGPIQFKMQTKTNKPIYNVIGITSFGYICGNPNFPSVYTNVSSFIDWIEETVWRGSKTLPTTMNPISSYNPSVKPTSDPTVRFRTIPPIFKPTIFYPAFKPISSNPATKPSTSRGSYRPTTSYPSFKPTTTHPKSEPTTYHQIKPSSFHPYFVSHGKPYFRQFFFSHQNYI